MALFGGKETLTVTDKEYSWKKNEIKIENGYLVSKGIINNIRVPLSAIETAVWSINPTKPTIVPTLKIIGRGVVLAELAVGIDIINDIQDWILKNIVK
ncbi:hypothetical protein M3699_14325 [Peribacillus simplex]|uniref:hypothetical protein n=1 Tax=Peribacillus simplex TaxID=1478 RepID=UPI00203B4611|nr:hypothetical protein [Peribacillus simplex]MCM3675030.1 hypothetical protein [Peribacillus simplex]